MSKSQRKLCDSLPFDHKAEGAMLAVSDAKSIDATCESSAVKPVEALTERERAAWTRLRAENASLRSPYFDLGYTQKVSGLRDDIRVIITYRNEEPIAFLPIQGGAFARPVGAPMTDYHGIIAPSDYEGDPIAMLAVAGVGALHYEAWLCADVESIHPDWRACAAIALPHGGPDWRSRQDSSYRRHLKGLRRRTRKAANEFGMQRLKMNTRSPEIFETLLTWKRAQYARTGKYDVLTTGWTEVLLKQLLDTPSKNSPRADMHALYFGDRLAAIDLGLTDGMTYHSWITAYEPDFHAVSPGMQLFECIIEQAAPLGYTVLDLGPGLEGYKHHYADENMGHVSSGFFVVSGPAAALSKLYGAAEQAGERSEVALGKLPGKIRRRYSQVSACDASLSGRAKAMLSAMTHLGKSSE